MSELGQDMSGDFSTAIAVATGKFTGDNCRPEFYLKSVHFENESEKEGRPVFRDVEYVRITIPGNRKSIVERKVREEDKRRWPREYLAWKQSGTMSSDGMPLEKWTLVSPAEVDTLKHFRIRTVEELSQLSDSQTQEVGMGTLRLRQLAQEWLAQSRGNAGVSQLAAKNQELEGRLELQADQIAELLKRLDKRDREGDADGEPKKRGRRKPADPVAEQEPAE